MKVILFRSKEVNPDDGLHHAVQSLDGASNFEAEAVQEYFFLRRPIMLSLSRRSRIQESAERQRNGQA
jgi:hypothetical protein